MKLAHRLILYSFAVVSVLVLAIMVIVDRRLHSGITQQSVEQLQREARLTAIQWKPGANADSLADAAGIALGHRVTLISTDGSVRGDSDFDTLAIRSLQNHAMRPEILQARMSGTGSSRRLSASRGDEELYVAVLGPLGFTRVSMTTRALNEVFERARRDILVAGGAALLLAGLLAALFARTITVPISRLRDTAQALAKHDFSERPLLDAPAEVGDLARSLHQLSRQLEALENVRRDFVANVSHELRTPLTVIGGFAETLVSDDLSPEQRTEFARTISVNTRRMQRIVDDLLDLSRIESGGWIPRPEMVQMQDLAADIRPTAQHAAKTKGIAIDTDLGPGAESVFADRTALRQVLLNLLENSVRHTPSGTITLFSFRDNGRGVWVGVRDTGEGIAEEHLPRIFERFYRADTGRSREMGGTGLGLAIVRHLATAHGGSVTATSSEGTGTTITVFFPDRRRET